jgi:NAD(P)-dependent dehydrogenase (short-subunit alcohol dehydrogenase family)
MTTYQANTLAVVRMVLRAVPAMREAGFGRVIQISSAVGMQPNSLGPDYSGSKAAINNFTISLAGSLKGDGITVNTVSPGIIATKRMIAWGHSVGRARGWGEISDEEMLRRLALDVYDLPAGRIGRDEDVAMMVCVLASPRSGYITGANHRIDGGSVRSLN